VKAWSFALYFGGLVGVVEIGDCGTRRFMCAEAHTVDKWIQRGNERIRLPRIWTNDFLWLRGRRGGCETCSWETGPQPWKQAQISTFNGSGATRRSNKNHGFIDHGNGRTAHPIRDAVIYGSCKHRICSTLERRRTIHACGLSPPPCTPAVYNAVSQHISDAVRNEPFV
jgi:hypothetical protein